MKNNIEVIGLMGNKMEKENSIMIKHKPGTNVYYKMEKELNGLMNKFIYIIYFIFI